MKKDNFLKGAFIATACLIFTKILGILYVIPFYSIIGSKGSILYGCAYNIYVIFINLSTVGLPLAISKLISEYNTLDYQNLKKRTYKIAGAIMIVTAVVSSIALFVFAPQIAELIIPDKSYGNTVSDIALVIRVSSTALIFVTLISMIRGYLQGMKYIRPSSFSQVIEQLVRVVVIVLGSYIYLKFIGDEINIAVSIAVFGATLGAIVSLMYLIHKKRKIVENKKYQIKEIEIKVTNKSILKKIITYTIPFVIMGCIGSSFELVDMFTVVRTLTKHGFSTNDAAIIMNIITTLGSKLNVIITSIASGIVVSLLPNLTSDFVKKDYTEIRNKINKALQIIIYITIPMATGLSFLAKPVWNIFYGDSIYGPKVFCVSIFMAVFSAIATNIMVIMQSLNRYKYLYISLIVGFAFNVFMNIPGMLIFDKLHLPMYYGNLIATMLGYLILIIISLIDLKKTFKVNYFPTIKQFIITLAASLAMVLVMGILKDFYSFESIGRLKSIITVLIYTLLGGFVYFFITFKAGSFRDILGDFIFKKKGRKNESRNS